MRWGYIKLDENLKIIHCPTNDIDGSITGHIVLGLKQWFDENPAERIRLGWQKVIYHDKSEIEYDRQTQYLTPELRRIDDYTVEEAYQIMNKSEQQMLLEELLESVELEEGFVFKMGGLEFL